MVTNLAGETIFNATSEEAAEIFVAGSSGSSSCSATDANRVIRATAGALRRYVPFRRVVTDSMFTGQVDRELELWPLHMIGLAYTDVGDADADLL